MPDDFDPHMPAEFMIVDLFLLLPLDRQMQILSDLFTAIERQQRLLAGAMLSDLANSDPDDCVNLIIRGET